MHIYIHKNSWSFYILWKSKTFSAFLACRNRAEIYFETCTKMIIRHSCASHEYHFYNFSSFSRDRHCVLIILPVFECGCVYCHTLSLYLLLLSISFFLDWNKVGHTHAYTHKHTDKSECSLYVEGTKSEKRIACNEKGHAHITRIYTISYIYICSKITHKKNHELVR